MTISDKTYNVGGHYARVTVFAAEPHKKLIDSALSERLLRGELGPKIEKDIERSLLDQKTKKNLLGNLKLLRKLESKGMWNLKELLKHANQTQTEINGKWVPARPINWRYRSLKERARQAWAVFKGRAEAFTWPEGQ